MVTSELSLLELLAFQANLAWPWQVAGGMLRLGGLALVLWGGPRLLFVVQTPRSSSVFGRRAGPAAWVGFAFAGYALFGHALDTWTLRRLGGDASIGALTPAWLVVYTIGLLLLARPPVSPVAAPGCLRSAARVRLNGGGAWT